MSNAQLTLTGHSTISRAEAEETCDHLLHRLEAMEDMLSGLGLSIPGPSRFAVYRSSLKRLCHTSGREAIDYESLYEVLLECDEFTRSINVLTQPPEVQGWRSIAERALGGQASMRLERGFTPARDCQFELFVAALLRRAGLPVCFAEPDLQVELPSGKVIGVAAKRVKSSTKLVRRISEGSEQIAKARTQGIVAVHLPFFTTSNLRSPDMLTAQEDLREETRAFTLENIKRIWRRVDKRYTFGLMVFAARLTKIGDESQLATVLSIYSTNLCDPTDDRCNLLDDITAKLDGCVETWFCEPGGV